MGKFGKLAKLAMTAGPMVFKAVQTYGPAIKRKRYVDANPDTVDNLTGKLKKYGQASKKSGVEGAQARIDVLREQVTYLYGSANTPEIAESARQWKEQLAKIEIALPLIDAMSPKSRRAELKKVDAKIDALSGKILAAVVQDDVEDADVVNEKSPEDHSA